LSNETIEISIKDFLGLYALGPKSFFKFAHENWLHDRDKCRSLKSARLKIWLKESGEDCAYIECIVHYLAYCCLNELKISLYRTNETSYWFFKDFLFFMQSLKEESWMPLIRNMNEPNISDDSNYYFIFMATDPV